MSRAPSGIFSLRRPGYKYILLTLDLEGICVSTGSACTTGETEPSFVLQAMGLPREWAIGSVRMTLGHSNTDEDIDHVLGVLPSAVEHLRAQRAHAA